jgi:hypothetical protein
LTQSTEGKEYISYESRRLLDAETRYIFYWKVVFIAIS